MSAPQPDRRRCARS